MGREGGWLSACWDGPHGGVSSFRLHSKMWNDVVMLEETMPETFMGLARDMATNHTKWAHINTSPTPYNEELPGIWNVKVGTRGTSNHDHLT